MIADIPLNSEAQEAIGALPFVGGDDASVSFWRVESAGHMEADIDRGEQYAVLALMAAKQFDIPLLLPTVLRDMVTAGRFTGVEAGFVSRIASAARAGSLN